MGIANRAKHHIEVIKADGSPVQECCAASVRAYDGMVFVYRLNEHDVRLEIGDIIRWHRPQPVGGVEEFVVLEPNLLSGNAPWGLSYSARVRYRGAADPARAGDTYHITITGHNARATVRGQDNSTNSVSLTNHQLFAQIRETATQVPNAANRTAILKATDELEQAQGQPTFSEKYLEFVGAVADHLGVFGPLLPLITQLAAHAMHHAVK